VTPVRLLAAAALAAALTAVPAGAARTRTISVLSVTVSLVDHDTGPKGASAGDTVLYRDRLLNAVPQFGRKKGAAVGSDHGKLTFTSARTATFDGTAVLPGGTLKLSGTVYTTTAGALVVPVVGGTGDFANARGTLTVGTAKGRVPNTYRLTFKSLAA
jgi:hypothetical protein